MVAYSFKPSFVVEILALRKSQTIRLPRKRHARPGERLQLFTGPRMAPTRIGGAVCHRVCDVRLDFNKHEVSIDDAIVLAGDDQLNAFAVRDGFGSARSGVAPWEFMDRFWHQTHPDLRVFPGVLVDWDDTFAPAVR